VRSYAPGRKPSFGHRTPAGQNSVCWHIEPSSVFELFELPGSMLPGCMLAEDDAASSAATAAAAAGAQPKGAARVMRVTRPPDIEAAREGLPICGMEQVGVKTCRKCQHQLALSLEQAVAHTAMQAPSRTATITAQECR